ncbi:MAG: GntR family transcriptional regulator [Clostridiales bacterium]|nr:GntR family transcriptional regulator [Clostridiales bacterium]
MRNYKEPRSAEIRLDILELIKKIVADGGTRTPTEVQLAERLGVSRTMIRDCLDVLEQDGYVNRIHGVGTIINKDVVNTICRLDLEESLYDMIRHAGAEPELLSVKYEELKANEMIAEKLNIEVNSNLIKISQVIGAGEIPVIYCMDYIPYTPEFKSGEDFADNFISIYELLTDLGKNELHLDLTELFAGIIDEELSDIMKLPVNTPILCTSEVAYDIFGEPELYTEEYFREDILHHRVLHKKVL